MQIKKVAQGCRLGNQAECNTPYKHESSKKLHRREHFQVHQCTHRSVYSTNSVAVESNHLLVLPSWLE